MARKQIGINLVASITSYVIGIGIGFFLTPYLIRTVGKEAYGFVALGNNFNSYTSLLFTTLGSMCGRFFTIDYVQGNRDRANKIFASAFYGNITMALIAAIPLALVVIFAEKVLNIPEYITSQIKTLLSLMFIASVLGQTTSVFGVATFCKNRLDLNSLCSVISGVLNATLLIILFTCFKPSVIYLGASALALSAFKSIWMISIKRRLLPDVSLSPQNIDFSIIRTLTSSGVWNSLNQLGTILLSGLDLLIINRFLGASSAGDYAIASALPNLVKSTVVVVVGVFTSHFTILYGKKDISGLLNSLKESMIILNCLVSLPIAFIFIYGDAFYSLWIKSSNAHLLKSLSIWIMVPFVVNAGINTLFNLNIVLNKNRIPALVLIVQGGLSALCALIFLTKTEMGLFAVPIAGAVLGILKNVTFTPIYAAKCLNLAWTHFLPDLAKGVLAVTIACSVFHGLKLLITIDSWPRLMCCFAGATLISLTLNLSWQIGIHKMLQVYKQSLKKLSRG